MGILNKSFQLIKQLSIYRLVLVRSLTFQIEKLKSRSLISVSGEDVSTFMQGLITNDITPLNCNGKAIFTLFLNNRGRVLYDSIIYKPETENTILVECDNKIQNELKNHLKLFRVRRKINIESCDKQLWVIYNKDDILTSQVPDIEDCKKIKSMTLCNGYPLKEDLNYNKYLKDTVNLEQITLFQDPRLPLLGVRLIVSNDSVISKLIENNATRLQAGNEYKILRYSLGIGEGVSELPPSNCLPLEANCDYMHGVSFHKGCYLGQELTARTHHTGVIRKRLMPLIFNSNPEFNFEVDAPVEIQGSDKKVGKLRGYTGRYGIGLLRISEALESSTKLKINGISVYTYMPSWWPNPYSKDSVISSTE